MEDNYLKAEALKSIQRDHAPKIAAKGQGQRAEEIIELVKEHHIAIHEDSQLMEILYTLDIGYEIPETLYHSITEILAFIYLAEDTYRIEVDYCDDKS